MKITKEDYFETKLDLEKNHPDYCCGNSSIFELIFTNFYKIQCKTKSTDRQKTIDFDKTVEHLKSIGLDTVWTETEPNYLDEEEMKGLAFSAEEMLVVVRLFAVDIFYSERSDMRLVKEIMDKTVYDEEKDIKYFKIIDPSMKSLVRTITCNRTEVNLGRVFNKNLPDKLIKQRISENRGGFLIFRGEPGCGKSTYLRYLIDRQEELNANFYILDYTLLMNGQINASKLLTLFGKKRVGKQENSVIILEDCELLLKSRDTTTGNSFLSNLLNLTDGLIGDSLNVKFICTFNTDLKNIDSAIMRKGRLMVDYEFEKLHGERLEALKKELGIENKEDEMSLAEIFNYDNTTAIKSEIKKSKIGF